MQSNYFLIILIRLNYFFVIFKLIQAICIRPSLQRSNDQEICTSAFSTVFGVRFNDISLKFPFSDGSWSLGRSVGQDDSDELMIKYTQQQVMDGEAQPLLMWVDRVP